MSVKMADVLTDHMSYGADNDDGSFELTWHFKHCTGRYTVTMENVRKARGTEDAAHKACVDFLNGKKPAYSVRGPF